ncbi:hypothetical protein SCBWM1_gp53 [Synechococcus phage S-CBWM1]|uniref:DUF551 domain-containing protein n=1 Tax=Synechococcus phage S-CBWM1 TaxID=2053653 RepID=A0A3G1L3I3_9CAUD|nr:hypothetical protein HOU61_gp144 [Synechococcus phage S-CBWM1]ATW62737.1 hypothetical protein SCBWM1_gp53 [Synechococcus phage S-CBWM1]
MTALWNIPMAYLERYHPVWTPVSEALPDPSRKVLAFYRNDLGKGRIVVAQWVPANTEEVLSDADSSDNNEELDKFFLPEGWYEQVDNWDDWDDLGSLQIDEGIVTHWMPLPKSPLQEDS